MMTLVLFSGVGRQYRAIFVESSLRLKDLIAKMEGNLQQLMFPAIVPK